jgi:hypothetical protein
VLPLGLWFALVGLADRAARGGEPLFGQVVLD